MAGPVASDRASNHRKKPPRRRKLRRIIFFSIVLLLLIVGGVAGALYWKMDEALNKISDPSSGSVSTLSENADPTYHSDKSISMVILGRDTRKETGSLNTDVMILAVANPQTKKVTMLSIPRDTRVKIPGYRGYHKVNSVYADGENERRLAERDGKTPTEDGISLTKKTLNELFGIPVDHYITIDFDGFRAAIDELDGVEVTVDRRLVYDDPTDDTHIDLKPGIQTLNGDQALDYVRHRHDNRGTQYFSSDYDRNRRQQEVIKAIVDKMTSIDVLPKVFNLIEVGSDHVHTDLSPEQIKGLAMDFKGINSGSVETLDNGGYWKMVGDVGYTYWPKENLYSIRSKLQSEMGITGALAAEVNDSPVFDGSEVRSTASSSKSSKKRVTEAAAQPAKTKPQPPPPKQNQQQPPTGETSPPDSAEGTVPANPDQPQTDPQQPQQPDTGGTPPANNPPALPPDIAPAPEQLPPPEGQPPTENKS